MKLHLPWGLDSKVSAQIMYKVTTELSFRDAWLVFPPVMEAIMIYLALTGGLGLGARSYESLGLLYLSSRENCRCVYPEERPKLGQFGRTHSDPHSVITRCSHEDRRSGSQMELSYPLGLAPGQEPMGAGGSFTVGGNARTVYTLLVSPLKIPEQ